MADVTIKDVVYFLVAVFLACLYVAQCPAIGLLLKDVEAQRAEQRTIDRKVFRCELDLIKLPYLERRLEKLEAEQRTYDELRRTLESTHSVLKRPCP